MVSEVEGFISGVSHAGLVEAILAISISSKSATISGVSHAGLVEATRMVPLWKVLTFISGVSHAGLVEAPQISHFPSSPGVHLRRLARRPR